MTIRLLDVNVLLALHDPLHPHYRSAVGWFGSIKDVGWATCPLTENGFIRIASNPNYRGFSNDPAYIADALGLTCRASAHEFWPDNISLLDVLHMPSSLASGQLADIYLLALAIDHGGTFATFDDKIPAHVLLGGAEALEVIAVQEDSRV